MWNENSSQWTILEPLCYSSFVFATLVYGVIGYKFCWLLPSEDHNQGTPARHESNGTTVRDHWEDMNQLRHQLGTNQFNVEVGPKEKGGQFGYKITTKFKVHESQIIFRIRIVIFKNWQLGSQFLIFCILQPKTHFSQLYIPLICFC